VCSGERHNFIAIFKTPLPMEAVEVVEGMMRICRFLVAVCCIQQLYFFGHSGIGTAGILVVSYSLLHVLVEITKIIVPHTITAKDVNETVQRFMGLYAFFVAVFCSAQLWFRGDDGIQISTLVAVCYLVTDCFFTRRPDSLIHHGLVIGVFCLFTYCKKDGWLLTDKDILDLYRPFVSVEQSSVFYCFLDIMKVWGFGSKSAKVICGILFAMVFFYVRVYRLFYVVLYDFRYWEVLMKVRPSLDIVFRLIFFCIAAFYCLNLYWAALIARKMYFLFGPK
jgi:hypothetical protein